jgi:diguanylate cyclase (GGDEF)-like protein
MKMVSTGRHITITWQDLMRTAVGILLAAQVGIVATATTTVPSPAGLALLLVLSATLSGTALWTISSMRKGFRSALDLRVGLRTKELEERMTVFEQMATTDALTGLLNRRGGEEAMGPHIARSRRMKTAISFVLVDIDKFKDINDRHGHAMGDRVLGMVSDIIKANVRSADLPIRWGGEEILLCLPDTDLAGAILVAEKLRGVIALLDAEARDLTVTASFGCAELGDDDLSVAIARADMQMYLAKAQGRNRVCPHFDEKTS